MKNQFLVLIICHIIEVGEYFSKFQPKKRKCLKPAPLIYIFLKLKGAYRHYKPLEGKIRSKNIWNHLETSE